ncbi:AAA family ATPase [Anatilimnocola sp. NA78]|uniref:AAA family ATPase n=1 Tax=Anatilimnocola sp. NA78 TaxID=3415683 RepID=UPI003CE483A5
MAFLRSLHLQGLLSFAPDSEPIELTPLNVLIGPNGSGKSNLIEAIGLLAWMPTSFSAGIREGGGVSELLWKGSSDSPVCSIEASFNWHRSSDKPIHRVRFLDHGARVEIVEEVIEDNGHDIPKVFYRNKDGEAELAGRDVVVDKNAKLEMIHRTLRPVDRKTLVASESILSQRKDPQQYPELTSIAKKYLGTQFFREWSFGRNTAVRKPQPVDLPSDSLLPDCSNLGLVLNSLEHEGNIAELNRRLSQFLPRFQRVSTRVLGGTIQIFFHEDGLRSPIPATRLSDGTLRYLAMLAILLSPTPPSLVCIEEPEMGLHPDAIALLAEVMVEAKERMQLIVTTHSDALVSALSEHSDSVLVCENQGGTAMRRVESGQVQHWLEKYRLGEVWRMGALGGNP